MASHMGRLFGCTGQSGAPAATPTQRQILTRCRRKLQHPSPSGRTGTGKCDDNRRRLSEPMRAPWYRTPISTRAPTVLIMDGLGRLWLSRRDRERAGSGRKRPPHPEAKVVEPVAGFAPVAGGRAEVLWI